MAELSTLARPYAKAAFAAAQETSQLAEWGGLLELTAQVVEDSDGRRILAHPTLTAEQKAAWLNDLAGDANSDAGRNFIQVLAENGRLELLSEINEQFDACVVNWNLVRWPMLNRPCK